MPRKCWSGGSEEDKSSVEVNVLSVPTMDLSGRASHWSHINVLDLRQNMNINSDGSLISPPATVTFCSVSVRVCRWKRKQ